MKWQGKCSCDTCVKYQPVLDNTAGLAKTRAFICIINCKSRKFVGQCEGEAISVTYTKTGRRIES